MVVGTAAVLSLLVSLIPQKEPVLNERIRGFVVGPLGEPVPAAEVWVTRLPMGEAQARVRADGEGRFLVQLPSAPWWLLHATSEGRAIVSKVVRDADEQQEIVLVDAATVTGTVRDRAGKVVASAPVCATRSALERGMDIRSTAVSGSDGRFTLNKVPLGLVSIRAWTGHDGEAERVLQVNGDAECDLAPADGSTTSLRIEIANMPPDKAAGVLVRIVPLLDWQVPDPWMTGHPDSKGAFGLDPIPDRSYNVAVEHPDVSIQPRYGFLEAEKGPHQFKCAWVPLADWSCSGTLLDAATKPIGAVRVAMLDSSSEIVAQDTTRSDGTFVLRARVAEGDGCRVYLPDDGWVITPAQGEQYARFGMFDRRLRSARSLEVRAGLSLELRAARSHAIAGRVVGADGHPVAGVRVELQDSAEHRTPEWVSFAFTCTADDGKFRIDRLPKATSRVRLSVQSAKGIGVGSAFAFPEPGSDHLEDLVLQPPAIIEGIIKDESDKPVPGGTVGICEQEHPSPIFGMTAKRSAVVANREGRFRFRAVPAGEWYVQAIVLGGSATQPTTQVTVKPGERAKVDAVLKAGAK